MRGPFVCFLLGFFFYESLAFEAPVSIQNAILKRVEQAALFSFYTPAYGYLYCSLYGAVAPRYSTPRSTCVIDPKKAREMRYHARNFTLRTLYLEQQYRLGYSKGFCLLQNGAKLFNATLIGEGYAVAQNSDNGSESEALRQRLFILEDVARRERRGLWADYPNEMECLRRMAVEER